MHKIMSNYIRFDWAMKRLLRNKANFAVLEGFLTTLLRDRIKIQKLLESESNQEEEFDKYNRVDLLAEDSKGTLLLIEIQHRFRGLHGEPRLVDGKSDRLSEFAVFQLMQIQFKVVDEVLSALETLSCSWVRGRIRAVRF